MSDLNEILNNALKITCAPKTQEDTDSDLRAIEEFSAEIASIMLENKFDLNTINNILKTEIRKKFMSELDNESESCRILKINRGTFRKWGKIKS